MANASIFAAFERMWHHIVAALGIKMEKDNPTGMGSMSMNRALDSVVGYNSTTFGKNCEASGDYAFANGYNSKATRFYSFVNGIDCEASGDYAFAHGRESIAGGNASVALGYRCNANGNGSIAIGLLNDASSEGSCVIGYNATSNAYQFSIGHNTNLTTASEGTQSGTSGTAFVVGNGSSTTPSNACRITYDGAVVGKQAYRTSGADYAEYFEWADSNAKNEDRIGYFVTFDDGRFIRKANENDYVLGVVSGNPSVLGNHDECWLGQIETDEWGRFVYVEETGLDELTGDTYEYTTFKINPDYDSSIQYVPRSERPEWDAIGMIGILSVRDDGTCQVNGYCNVANGGIATRSDTGYRVIERVSDNIVKIILK